jgi:hypothetical protein
LGKRHIESFHDKLRDECLESWRVEYNQRRPHSALGYQTPSEYAGTKTNGSMGAPRPQNPAPLAAAGVRGELRINAIRSQINENTNEPAELQF